MLAGTGVQYLGGNRLGKGWLRMSRWKLGSLGRRCGIRFRIPFFVSFNSGDEDMEEVELVAEVRLGDVGALSGILRRNLSWRMQKSGGCLHICEKKMRQMRKGMQA